MLDPSGMTVDIWREGGLLSLILVLLQGETLLSLSLSLTHSHIRPINRLRWSHFYPVSSDEGEVNFALWWIQLVSLSRFWWTIIDSLSDRAYSAIMPPYGHFNWFFLLNGSTWKHEYIDFFFYGGFREQSIAASNPWIYRLPIISLHDLRNSQS